MIQEKITTSGEETSQIGEQLAEKVRDGGVLCLYGDLGGGKTTFTQGLAHALGIERQVPSPTFLVIRKYEIGIKNQESNRSFYHIDLYRLGSEREIEEIGVKEILDDPENIVVIEWSEKLSKFLPETRIDVHFEYVDEEKRKITIESHPVKHE